MCTRLALFSLALCAVGASAQEDVCASDEPGTACIWQEYVSAVNPDLLKGTGKPPGKPPGRVVEAPSDDSSESEACSEADWSKKPAWNDPGADPKLARYQVRNCPSVPVVPFERSEAPSLTSRRRRSPPTARLSSLVSRPPRAVLAGLQGLRGGHLHDVRVPRPRALPLRRRQPRGRSLGPVRLESPRRGQLARQGNLQDQPRLPRRPPPLRLPRDGPVLRRRQTRLRRRRLAVVRAQQEDRPRAFLPQL